MIDNYRLSIYRFELSKCPSMLIFIYPVLTTLGLVLANDKKAFENYVLIGNIATLLFIFIFFCLGSTFLSCLLGDGTHISRTENFLHTLGSLTTYCCTDKKGTAELEPSVPVLDPIGSVLFGLKHPYPTLLIWGLDLPFSSKASKSRLKMYWY